MEKTFENLKNLLVKRFKRKESAWLWYDKLAGVCEDLEEKKDFERIALDAFEARCEIKFILQHFYTDEEIKNMTEEE